MTSKHLFITCGLVCLIWGAPFAAAYQESGTPPEQTQKTDDKPVADKTPPSRQLSDQQNRLTNRYKRLEQKLFDLYEYEIDLNPDRSRLLKQAYQASQEQLTAQQMEKIVQQLASNKLRQAKQDQGQVLDDMKKLLELLQSEDRRKRVEEKKRKVQEAIKEVERLIRIQRGIRGQTEGGVDTERLARSQAGAAKRAADLAKDLRDSQTPQDESGDASSDSSDPANKDADSPPNGGSQDSQQDSAPPSEQGQQNPSQQPSSGGQSSGQTPPNQQTPPSPEEQAGKRIQAAQQRMQEAQKKLEQAQRDESVEDMEQAEEELAKAKKELEEILRQLREEEIGRTLAMLEGRFRKMLERELRIYESTKKLAKTVPEQRNSEFEIRSSKLGVQQSEVAAQASRALLLLREEGSSVAFPETVEQMRDEMVQVAARLSSARVDTITQELQQEIIETLDYLVEALVQAQQDMEDQQNQPAPSPGNGQPGEQPLVEQIAELKLIRGLQIRVNKRHLRYSKLLENPDDPVGYADDPDIQQALQRLSERQKRIQRITRDIVLGKNK